MITCIYVQVKNRMDLDPDYPLTATIYQTPRATSIQIISDLPYLSLYMSLGPELNGACVQTPAFPGHNLRSGAKTIRQKSLAAFTISPTVYKFLNDDSVRLLSHINQCWIDPVNLQESENDRQLVVNMLPCQKSTHSTL
jgi:hypothetical protein